MRFNEIASADDQLALWRLISDNVWSAVLAQSKEQARLKAQAAATPKPSQLIWRAKSKPVAHGRVGYTP